MGQADIEERRRKILNIAASIIAREGIDAATFRHIAAEAGCSTTLISECCEDKTDLLVRVYRMVSAANIRDFEERVATGKEDIVDLLVDLTALDEKRWLGWRVYLAYWEKAVRDPLLAGVRGSEVEAGRLSIERAIVKAYGPGGDISHVAQAVIALIHGISIQVLCDERSWSRARVRVLLAQQIETGLARGPVRTG